MVPLPPSTVEIMPEVPLPDWPPEIGQVSTGPWVQASAAVSERYSVKFSVVPESSERWTGTIGSSGRSASGLCSAMAGSFQLVMSPAKMPPSASGRSEEHTSELQSRGHLVCRLLLEKKKHTAI